MFDWIEVRTVGGMIIHRYLMILKKFGNNLCLMYWCIILLESGRAWLTIRIIGGIGSGAIDVLYNRKYKVSRMHRYIFALTDFTMKGTKVPFCFPPKQPHTITDTPCPFLTAIM